ncbi:Helicase-related protein [Spironucleus salmonicida]|uniref:Helicase-related protein n=1 Tax=Spironucleus salmonicida TaxID=348837 RepID=V6LF10_9EUKA|nr:Helicase-related protein [Spironucleus salmonicida]|eukprot:EST42266.1 Helicase-related protein [Spironucleus salmonicida]
MNISLPMSQEQFMMLIKQSTIENAKLFLSRATRYLQNEDVQLIDTIIDPFKLDNAERIQRFNESKYHYKIILLEMLFTETQIDYVLNQYTLTKYHLLPSFSEIVTQVINSPKLRTLQDNDFQNLDHQITSSQFKLTELQQSIYNHAVQYPVNGVFVLATGFGKTVLAAFLVKHSFKQSSKVLFLVNSLFIKQQAQKVFNLLFNICTLDFDGENYNNQQIVFSTFQSVHKLPNLFLDNLSHLIIDEAHHILAPTFLQVFQRLKQSCEFVAGFTATLTHLTDLDGSKIVNQFNNQLYCNLPWFVAKRLNLFPKVKYLEIVSFPGYKLQKTTNQSLSYQSIKESYQSKNLALFLRQIQLDLNFQAPQIAQILAVFFAQFGICSHTIVFLSTVNQCDDFVDYFNSFQPFCEAKSLHYKTKNQQLIINDFKTTKNSVIATVAMATEGFDLPEVDCVVLGRKTQSERVFVQQMGRGLRKSQEKKQFMVIDCVGAIRDRWARLREENTENAVWEAIREFWEVETFL